MRYISLREVFSNETDNSSTQTYDEISVVGFCRSHHTAEQSDAYISMITIVQWHKRSADGRVTRLQPVVRILCRNFLSRGYKEDARNYCIYQGGSCQCLRWDLLVNDPFFIELTFFVVEDIFCPYCKIAEPFLTRGVNPA